MAAGLRAHLRNGDNEQVNTYKVFADLLTTQLRELQMDKHLRIGYEAQGVLPDRPRPKAGAKRSPQVTERMLAFGKYQNFGFYKMERLTGNVMVVRLDAFMDLDIAKAAISSMMNVTAHADALIIDLRENGGGDPRTVAHVASYLFDNKKLHLSSMYFRATKERKEFWTDPAVTGPHLGGNKPVYILTSKETFSAAEDFSYTLQHLKRATVIGETTGGGAHPIQGFRVDPYLVAIIPVGQSIDAVTQSNWEGTGVVPDIALPADKALDKAHALALKHILPTVKDEEDRAEINKKLAELEG
jgi:C-terminal processing protease CtpA/Prc